MAEVNDAICLGGDPRGEELVGSTAASYPFNKPSADVVLRTGDKVDFQVRKAILEEASPMFTAMFSLPQPTHGPIVEPQDSAPAVIPVAESSTVLDALLRMCYPVAAPKFSTLAEVVLVLSAANKYQMYDIVAALTELWAVLAEDRPLQAYALAIIHNLEDAASSAAKIYLHHTLPGPYFDDLENITGAAYHRLIQYREECVWVALAATKDLGWLKASDYPWIICKTCPSANRIRLTSFGNQRDVLPSGPFQHHLNRLEILLKQRPCRIAVEDPAARSELVSDMTGCRRCKWGYQSSVAEFNARLADMVESGVSKVVLGIGRK
ncbi:hypothetical protein BC628DRAFT_822690 [Trametes gibbosa]|nr:hypothetical protein BC628DRAFT_822690 [Trametes gibbosa]